MLRVLLVDDEPFIVQGLQVLIDWKQAGFEIAATAANGEEALAVLQETEVDLIIADIRMPVMSGIALLQTIRETQISHAHFVILSGHNDFQYAKQAIHYSCLDYILKPIQREELLGILQKVANLQESSQQTRETLRRQERALLEHHLFSVLTGRYDAQMLTYVQEALSLTGPLRYMLLQPEYTAPEFISNADKQEVQKQLQRRCAEFLGAPFSAHCFVDISDDSDNFNVGMIYTGGMAQSRRLTEAVFFRRLHDTVRDMPACSLSLFLGKEVQTLSELCVSYRSIAVLKSFHMFQKDVPICSYEEQQLQKTSDKVLCKKILDTLIFEIEHRNPDGISEAIDRLYEELAQMGMDTDIVSLNTNYLLFQLIQLAVEHDNGVNQKEIARRIGNGRLSQGNIGRRKAYLKQFSCDYAEYLMQLRKGATGGMLKDIERDIRESYRENLTLKELSKKYFVNSAYLGQLFRKKYGISFKDYLNNYRMEQAAGLLLRTDKRVYEIAKEVGYQNLDYFINRFITCMGCTPVKYRKQRQCEAAED